MKRFFLFIILLSATLSIPVVANADDYADNLLKLISKYEKENVVDSLLNTRLELIKYVRNSDFELFLRLSNANLKLAKQEGLNWGQIDTYMEMADVFILKGIFSEALTLLNEALKLAEIDEYRPYVGWVSISIGNAYEGMVIFPKAIDFYQRAFQVFQETENTEGMALSLSNISNCFKELNELDKAEEYLAKCIEYRKQLTNLVELGYAQMYLAEIKMNRGRYSEAKTEFESIFDFISKSMTEFDDAFQVSEAKNLLATLLKFLSDCERLRGNSVGSIKYLENAVFFSKEVDNVFNIAAYYNLLGNIYFKERKYGIAISYADSAANIANAGRIFIEEAKSYQLFSSIYSHLNQPEKALNYYKQFKSINDSMYNKAVIQAISDVDVLVKTVEQTKNNQILALKIQQDKKLKNIEFIATSLFILAVSIIAYLIFQRYRKVKRLNNQLSSKNQQILENNKIQEALNGELQSLIKSKDKFHSIIAHDLKSPSATIFSLLSLLKQSYHNYNDKSRQDLINMAYESSDQTLKLLDNLLTWSRIQGGHLKVEFASFNLTEVLTESNNLMLQPAKNKGITPKIVKSDDVIVKADKEMITTVIRNLLTNAIKFSSTGNHIESGIKLIDREVEVWVKDEGIGIPKSNLDSLFDVDSKFQRRGTQKESGTGLGLQLCNEFIKLHKGRMLVESEEGKGSRFSFIIPV